jgi:hypothetical protein
VGHGGHAHDPYSASSSHHGVVPFRVVEWLG